MGASGVPESIIQVLDLLRIDLPSRVSAQLIQSEVIPVAYSTTEFAKLGIAVDDAILEIHVYRGALSPPREAVGRVQFPDAQVVHSLGYAVVQLCVVRTVASPKPVDTVSV